MFKVGFTKLFFSILLISAVAFIVLMMHKKYKRNEIDTPLKVLKGIIANDEKVIFVPNPGNGGDALIAQGTYDFFKKIGLKYEIGKENIKYSNKTLIYGGGGNIIGWYKGGENFVKNNIKNNRIIILPHTIKGVDEMIKMFKKEDAIIVRDFMSYDYVKTLIPHQSSLYLSKDMAFYINMDKMTKPMKGKGELNFFRTDIEKKNGFKTPDNNFDVSVKINYDGSMRDKDKVYKTTYEFLNELNKYEVINTSRLHGSIGGSLMKKKVNLYDNSYGKNKAVYEYSFKNNKDIQFIKI